MLNIYLFGKFRVHRDSQILVDLLSRKDQEMLAYLLLHHQDYHSREVLAGLLWGDSTTSQSKKYLRNSLWRLHSALDSKDEHDDILLVDRQWVHVNPEAELWLDVDDFEQVFALFQRIPGGELNARSTQILHSGIKLYQSGLLEGWYQDWCLLERDRFQSMYLYMLEKMMAHYETQGNYWAGMDYGALILRCDSANEKAHRCLMRLLYLSGNRIAALRQYKRCIVALLEEFDVRPSKQTVELYEQIRSEQLASQVPVESTRIVTETAPRDQISIDFKLLDRTFTKTQSRLQQLIKAVEGQPD